MSFPWAWNVAITVGPLLMIYKIVTTIAVAAVSYSARNGTV
jgi:hypothetical protein